jgi:uncharacterized membrane protein
MKKILTVFFNYFLRGLLVVVPTAVTLYVIVQLFRFIDGLLARQMGPHLPSYGLIPGLGILTLVLLITLLGFFVSSFIGRPLVNSFSALLDRAPLIKTLYSAIKDLLSAFVGQEKRFDQPVLVRFSQSFEVERIGFITRSELGELGLGSEKVAVYLPHAYAWSGNLIVVPRANVTSLSCDSAEAMKFIVSGGVSGIRQRAVKNGRAAGKNRL